MKLFGFETYMPANMKRVRSFSVYNYPGVREA